MSKSVQPFDPNGKDDIFQSFFGLANQMMNEMMRDGSGVKVFGVSSMNVTQISRGPDGRPRIVQAHDERRMGPGGVWQTKKALRDPDRGIDRMQVGYFIGDQGEIVERTRDPATGQYRQETKRRGGDPNFSHQWRTQAQQQLTYNNRQHQA